MFLLGLLTSPYFYIGVICGALPILVYKFVFDKKDMNFIAELSNEVMTLQQNLLFIKTEAIKKYGLTDMKTFSTLIERLASDFNSKSRERISKKITDWFHKSNLD